MCQRAHVARVTSRAVTKAHIELVELREAIKEGRLVADGKVLQQTGHAHISKVCVRVSVSSLWLSFLSVPLRTCVCARVGACVALALALALACFWLPVRPRWNGAPVARLLRVPR